MTDRTTILPYHRAIIFSHYHHTLMHTDKMPTNFNQINFCRKANYVFVTHILHTTALTMQPTEKDKVGLQTKKEKNRIWMEKRDHSK